MIQQNKDLMVLTTETRGYQGQYRYLSKPNAFDQISLRTKAKDIKKDKKSFFQKITGFKLASPWKKKKAKKVKRIVGCECVLPFDKAEFCNTVNNLLERIDKVKKAQGDMFKENKEKKTKQKKSRITKCNSNYKAKPQPNHIPIASKNLFNAYYGKEPTGFVGTQLFTVQSTQLQQSDLKTQTTSKVSFFKVKDKSFKDSEKKKRKAVFKVRMKKTVQANDKQIEIKKECEAPDLSHKTFERSCSNQPKKQINISSIVGKDVNRTFQFNSYFTTSNVKFLLKEILIRVSTKNGENEYTQGMNYVGGAIVYHCYNYTDAIKIMTFLLNKLEMFSVYRFLTIHKHINTLKKLLSIHLPEINKLMEIELEFDYNVNMLDWFFCLGLDKIPLELTTNVLTNLVRHGWYYFYRLLISYFEAFKNHIIDNRSWSKKNRDEFQMKLKNFHKHPSFNWSYLLSKAQNRPLNDKIIDNELGWFYKDCFSKPALIL